MQARVYQYLAGGRIEALFSGLVIAVVEGAQNSREDPEAPEAVFYDDVAAAATTRAEAEDALIAEARAREEAAVAMAAAEAVEAAELEIAVAEATPPSRLAQVFSEVATELTYQRDTRNAAVRLAVEQMHAAARRAGEQARHEAYANAVAEQALELAERFDDAKFEEESRAERAERHAAEIATATSKLNVARVWLADAITEDDRAQAQRAVDAATVEHAAIVERHKRSA